MFINPNRSRSVLSSLNLVQKKTFQQNYLQKLQKIQYGSEKFNV
ncbi:hypothetical protein M153_1920005428 [Pseudoloma neurophilia]|uniref:Uncharacterized protein n=1 Tax=Pseudoloma neurophilia TaxID=146866 RepID=A0A0R0LZ88_9MICR|nr:hypothetical protein M153_1920005428 [Pseudoloma neurophilia]